MSAKPEFRVFVDFDNDGSFATSGDDISLFVMRGSISLGVDDLNDHVARAGKLTLQLKNADRRFSPAGTAGPYSGKLLPRRPVRVQAVHLGGTLTLFEGHTKRWLPEPGEHAGRTCLLECGDLLDRLNVASIGVPLREAELTGTLVRHILNQALGAPAASATANFSANPSNNDYIVINGTSLVFKTALSVGPTVPNEVLIGATIEDTVDRLVAAVGGGEGMGTTYSTGTARPTDVVAAPNPTFYREVMKDSPIRYYRLGEAAGTAIVDAGANRANGTYVSATLGVAGALAGDPNKAVSLNGSTDYGTLPTLEIANRSFSVEAWVKPDSAPPVGQVYFTAYAAAASNQAVFLTLYDTGVISFSFYTDDLQYDTVSGLWDAWHHIMLTYDFPNDLAAMFYDGVQVAQAPNGPISGANPTLWIGSREGGVAPLKGDLDELAIYWHGLSAARAAAHFAARNVAPGVTFTCPIRGAFGNGIPLAKSSAAITLSGATLAGGSDLPAGADVEAGTRAPDVAGDGWTKDVTALQALQQVADTEYGLAWVGRDGQFHFKDWSYPFKRATATPDISLSGELRHNGAMDEDEVANHVTVRMTPRSIAAAATTVVARSDSVVQVPGKSGTARYNPNTPLENPEGGATTISLQFSDPETGEKAGAKDLVLPLVPTTDWTANEARDGTGPDYTGNPNLKFSAAVTANEVQLSVENTALGPLYLTKVQVRGRLVTKYDPVEIVRENAASQASYGLRREQVELPLPVDQAFAESLAAYFLDRYKDPAFRITQLDADNRLSAAGVSLLDIELGDVLALSEAQTGVQNARLLVTGVEYAWSRGVLESLKWHVRPLDDASIGLFGDAALGKFDVGHFGL